MEVYFQEWTILNGDADYGDRVDAFNALVLKTGIQVTEKSRVDPTNLFCNTVTKLD